MNKDNISKNINIINAAAAAHNARLCAVIKNRSLDEIRFAIEDCKVTLVGENRVQELLSHYELLSKLFADVHFIGKLQTNKVKYIIDKVSCIESLDSEKLAYEIQRRAAAIGKRMKVFIEVNIGEEEQKSGIMPSELEKLAETVLSLENLDLCGLMTVAPKCENESDYILYFEKMRRLLKETIEPKCKEKQLSLSMGMSGNYMTALEHGSTEIRVGTGIFGERQYNTKMKDM